MPKNNTSEAQVQGTQQPTVQPTKQATFVSSRLTKAELLDIIRNGHTGPPLTYDEFYRCAIATVSRWCVRVREGGFGSTSTDGIKTRLDTLCRIYQNR